MFRYPLYLLQDDDFGRETTTLSGVSLKLWFSLAVVSGMGLGKIPAVFIFSGLTPAKRSVGGNTQVICYESVCRENSETERSSEKNTVSSCRASALAAAAAVDNQQATCVFRCNRSDREFEYKGEGREKSLSVQEYTRKGCKAAGSDSDIRHHAGSSRSFDKRS
jgi:hypothetical protein